MRCCTRLTISGVMPQVVVPSWRHVGIQLGDNGAGTVYIRKIKEDSVLRELAAASPDAPAALEGDAFKSINGVDVPAGRHADLARYMALLPPFFYLSIRSVLFSTRSEIFR
jgi:hypothetical protein